MSTPEIYSDEIDLRLVLRGLLSRKKLIIRGVGITTIITIIFVLLMPRSFESTGFFKFSSVSIPKYKYYMGAFEDVNLLRSYITKYHEDTTWKVTADIFDEDAVFEPVYGFGKNPKNLMKENTVLGVYITCTAETAEEAQKKVETLGGYLQTNLVNMEIWKYYAGMGGRLNSSILISKSAMVEKKLAIEILNNKIELINNNLAKYASATETYDRQVVKLDGSTEKYLPLPQQLIATMISLNNLDIEIDQLDRQTNIDNILLGYVDRIEHFIVDKGEFLINKGLLGGFIEEKEGYFKGLKEDRDKLTALYRTESKLQHFSMITIDDFNFVSGPILPQAPGKPMKVLIVLSVFFASLVSFMTYGIFMSWWNKVD